MYTFQEEPHCEKECCGCEDKERDFKEMKYWMKQIIEQVYSNDELNPVDFEDCLQEMCALVNLKIPTSPMLINKTKPKTETIIPLNEWISFNNQYLTQLTK